MSLRSLALASAVPMALLLTAPGPLKAQQVDAPTSPCNTTNIRWVLPGNFEAARQRAAAEQRILLVNGVSFGIDDAGAKCATKGKW